MGLVDEVQGDAAAGQPTGQVGVLGGGLARERDRLVAPSEAEQARGPGRGQLDARRAEAGMPTLSAMRSASAGRPAPASSVARRASTAAISSGSVSRCRAASWAASAPSRSRRAIEAGAGEALGEVGPLGVGQRLVPHRGDDALDLVVVALDGVGLGQHLGPFARRHALVVRRGVDQADGERRVVAGERQAGGTQQLVAGDLPTGGDAPQGDLDDVLASPWRRGPRRCRRAAAGCAAGAAGGSRARSTSPYSGWASRTAVRRPGRHDGDQPAGLQRLQRRRPVEPLEVGEPEALADGQQLEHGEAGRVDAGEVLGDELLQGGGRRQRRGQLPGAAGVDEDPSFPRPADQLGQHLQVAARQPGQLGQRRRGHRPSRARCSSAPSSSRDSGSRSRRTR